ncbi:hypothetical protein NKI20_21935 [Mesorhizobium sp. M0830]|uniref:hypothetical protein n=1 Tax=Mesorhizobium sp. M0830 TaxID=2957008 RepID=UPI00333775BC
MPSGQEINGSCVVLLEPFSWTAPRIVRVPPNLFEPEIRNPWPGKVFATMPL